MDTAPFATCLGITGAGAIFLICLAVSIKRSAAMSAYEVIDSFSVDEFRVRIPPRQAAFIRAELFFTLVRSILYCLSAEGTILLIGRVGVLFAIVFDLTNGQIQTGSDFSVTISLLLESNDFVFFLHSFNLVSCVLHTLVGQLKSVWSAWDEKMQKKSAHRRNVFGRHRPYYMIFLFFI